MKECPGCGERYTPESQFAYVCEDCLAESESAEAKALDDGWPAAEPDCYA